MNQKQFKKQFPTASFDMMADEAIASAELAGATNEQQTIKAWAITDSKGNIIENNSMRLLIFTSENNAKAYVKLMDELKDELGIKLISIN